MSNRESSKTAFNVLSRNFELVEKACYENNGDLPLGDDACSKIVDSLVRNRLAYYLENELYVRIHSKVRSLIYHVGARYRFREKHGEFASLIDSLEFALDSYRRASNKVRGNNLNNIFDEIREIILDLTELMTETVNMYNHFVLDDFSIAKDVDERIIQTQRCKNELVKINEILSYLSVERLLEWGAIDRNIDYLLLNIFKKNLDRCAKDLNALNLKLIERLDKLNKDKVIARLNLLIDAFSERFAENPNYRPNFELAHIPPKLYCVKPLELKAYAELQSPIEDYQAKIAEIGKKISLDLRLKSKPKETKKEDILDNRKAQQHFKLDENEVKLNFLFEAVLSDSYKNDVSAVDCYKKLKVDLELEDWLFLVINAASSRERMIARHAKYEEVYSINYPFDGTYYISDIIFRKNG